MGEAYAAAVERRSARRAERFGADPVRDLAMQAARDKAISNTPKSVLRLEVAAMLKARNRRMTDAACLAVLGYVPKLKAGVAEKDAAKVKKAWARLAAAREAMEVREVALPVEANGGVAVTVSRFT